MKDHLLFCIIVFSFSSCIKGKVEYEYYPTGNIMWEKRYHDGKLNGTRKEYYMNGKLKSKQTFKNGRCDGIVEELYENGAIKAKYSFTTKKC